MAFITVENLNFTYNGIKHKTIDRMSFHIEQGETVLLAGPSGSGKSTLLRILDGVVPNFTGGTLSGNVHFAVSEQQAKSICGLVMQDPEKQLVMTTVEREIAFGLENLGLDVHEMKLRVEETLQFFDLGGLRHRKTWELSGGQKQTVAIASIVAMNPEVLLLDEPTSQLDPISAEQVLHLVEKINRDLGITVLIAEHRIEKCLPWMDRVLFIEDGTIQCNDAPELFVKWAFVNNYHFIPSFIRCCHQIGITPAPLTMKDAIPKFLQGELMYEVAGRESNSRSTDEVLSVKKLKYMYKESQQIVLHGITTDFYKGEIVGIIGSNGVGKSTLLQVIAGLLKPTSGKIKKSIDYIGYLSQNPNDYLIHDRLDEELAFTQKNVGKINEQLIQKVLKFLNLEAYKSTNPRDLSGGERQRAALASILVADPLMILLDEPTRGIDPYVKKQLGEWIVAEKKRGKTIVIVTHDIEFIATISERLLLLANGEILSEGTPREVLHNGMFYTTPLNRLFRKKGHPVLTEEDLKMKQETPSYASR